MAPLEFCRVEQRSHVGFVGLADFVRAFVGNRACVVLVGESREVMTELVYEQIVGPFAVGRRGAVQTIDASTAVRFRVRKYLDRVVRCR